MTGDLKLTMCNEHCVVLGTGIIRDVAHYLLSVICLQGGHCNHFSVTKLIKDARLLELTRVHCA